MGLLTISDRDYRRLTGITESELTYWRERRSLAQLRGELERAEIRPSAEMPGDRVGSVVDWEFENRKKRLKIERLFYQPESRGHFER